MDEATVEMVTAAQVEDLALVADESVSDEALREELRKRTKARMEALGDAAEAMGLTEETAEQAIGQASTPWFRSLMRADPAVYLRRAEVPVLALFGGKDSQVAAEENAEALREARPDADIRILPGLNHLFQHAETGGIDEYSQIEETVAPEVLEAITEWIGERSGSAAGE
jgi:pimeloyl-ACP methyl ester carboxylesterase